MAKRKTIPVEHLKERFNNYFLNSDDREEATRTNMGSMLADILISSGNYHGFQYLSKGNMKKSMFGTTIGIDQEKPEAEWFIGTDSSRVNYF